MVFAPLDPRWPRLGERWAVRPKRVTEPPFASLTLDGVTQYGLVVFPAPLDISAGCAVVAQVAKGSATGMLWALRNAAADYNPAFTGGLASPNADRGHRATYIPPTGSTVIPGTGTGGDTPDSNGFLALMGSVRQSSPTEMTVQQRSRGIGGPGSLYQESDTKVAGLATTLTHLTICRESAPVAYLACNLARVAVFIGGGDISESELALLWGDGTLATDWRTAIPGRAPTHVWETWRGADAGATYVVPDRMGGPAATFYATTSAHLSATIPTGHA